ncbi:protein-disulfide isomerase [Pseudochelatococcus lubricantis]|uniref:Protein-disulfide isomerase n=1 Tax=Pseudochelatococcus lubricantis TaxID=1538102 RepID=A0ABX0V4F2_9HYPH|nr:DsbA family protein [Pseudochelatococcus lubricantis]NIJ59817.1 protein-disulfide isomerase [Pseudochelatococcus lubricantis]
MRHNRETSAALLQGSNVGRRALLSGFVLLGVTGLSARASGQDAQRDLILHDPEAPVGGNPDGNVTIVTFFDYNCPFCKRSVGPMNTVVRADGKVRVVYKDWPILAVSSVYGAKLALAAKRQGKYLEAHHALMNLKGRPSEDDMHDAVAKAGVNMKRMGADAQADSGAITALLQRNNTQAEELGLRGTPAFLIDPFLIPAALDEAGFRQVISDARARG